MPDHKPGYTGASHALNKYWTRGAGLTKWVASPHPWTTLRNHLLKYMPPHVANGLASSYFHRVFGIWPGHRKGVNPIGPG